MVLPLPCTLKNKMQGLIQRHTSRHVQIALRNPEIHADKQNTRTLLLNSVEEPSLRLYPSIAHSSESNPRAFNYESRMPEKETHVLSPSVNFRSGTPVMLI